MDKFTDFFSIDVWTIIFSLGNLLILFLLMKKFLFKPVAKILEEREKLIKDKINSAEAAEAEANAKNEEYSALLANAKSESEEIIKTATRRASLDSEKILQTAREQASDIVKKGEQQVEMERKQAFMDIKEEISGMAVSIASAVVGREVSNDEHKEFIDRAIEEMGEPK